ncbi:MAG TPA: ATP-binding protein [Gaiellaceae bacterium]|nr:ATP-binding protein [Gaiellaceae bacterium]
MTFLRRRQLVTSIAVAGLFLVWGLMLAFSWSAKLGLITLAPFVAVIGFDVGVTGGIVAAALAMTLWLVAANADQQNLDNVQITVRLGSLLALALGSALAGRRLRESERNQRSVAALQSALIDATLDGICLTDADGHILISNKPLRRLVAELRMPLEGTVPDRLLAIADAVTEPERYRRRMLEIARTPGEATTDEFEIAGTGRVFRGYTAPVPEAETGFRGRIWTLREVTADRELDRMRDAFVATVSHELRTPLTSISGFLEMLLDEEHALGDAGKRYLDVIRRSTDRLHALVEDLLLIAQIEARRIELAFAPVDLGDVAESAAESARPAAADRGVRIEVSVDTPPPVRADRTRIAQVLDNLVSNAVKFSDSGGTVTIRVERDGEGARVVVRDDGIGIPADEQPQIFSRFFRASTATRRAIPGTGLGLAISRALVEQHGGTIVLESREGEGTAISIALPGSPR